MTDLSNKQTTSASNKQLGDSQSAESFDPGEFIYTDNLALLRLAQQRGDLNSIPGWSEYGNKPWIAFALHEGAFVAGGNSYAEVHEMLIRTVRELLLTSEARPHPKTVRLISFLIRGPTLFATCHKLTKHHVTTCHTAVPRPTIHTSLCYRHHQF